MEAHFAHTYVILFGKLAVGGLLSLAVPPFFEMERGFYKSTGAVFVAMAYLMAAGEAYLYLRYGDRANVTPVSVTGWLIFAALFSAYLFTLFVERPLLRARLFPAAVAAGFLALVVTGLGYVPTEITRVAGIPFAASMAVGAATTGAAVTGMLLGHWYLIDTGLDLMPLKRMLVFCRACVRLEIIVVVAAALTMWVWPGRPWAEGFELVFGERFFLLFVARVSAWMLALFLLFLIHRTLAIPQTMAATGLFYVQALVVAVGEICGHWLLFRTGIPL